MRKLTLFLLLMTGLMCCLHTTMAQTSIDQFTILESQGQMPSDFQKILKQDKEMTDYNVFLREMFMEGKILYGTKLNDYVNTVIDNLLKDDPVLRSKIHAYIVKSPEVNACATKNGLVLVNLGLLAQVSNESELAFVLAHEISHFVEKHGDVTSGKKDTIKDRNMLDYYVKYQNRSREQETAADRIALTRFFANSGYSYNAMMGVFDVLQYSDLPFDEVPFPKDMVETDFYQFPSNYYLANVASITNRDNMVDTLFTHPNIAKRRAAAQALTAGKSEDGRSAFVQPEELFNEVRELARFECLNCFLTNHEFDQAFYNAYVLQGSHPDNAFLEEVLVSAIYGFSKHKNYGETSDVLQPYSSVEGEMQQTSYFFSKLTKAESSLLAFRAAWKAHKNHPDNRYYDDVLKDALKDVLVNNKMKYQDFSDYPMGTNPDSIVVEQPEVEDKDTLKGKYAHIKKQKQTPKVIPTTKFKTQNYMLVDIHRDSAFAAMARTIVNEAEDEKILDFVTKKNPAVEFSNLLIAEPQYLINPKSERSNKLSKTLSGRLSKNITRTVRHLGLNPITYSDKDVCSFTTEQYNGYAKLQQWLNEYFQGDGLEMYYHISKDMSSTYELAGTSKICLMGVKRVPATFVTVNKFKNLFLAALCPYVLPMSVTTFALPRYNTGMYILVADYETGETAMSAGDRKYSEMSEAYVNSFMYDALYKFVKGK